MLDPGLYLVATPIGNLEDITLRALRILKSVDRIACEDTRQTQKLLNHFDISTPAISYHQHNEQTRAVELVALLQQGGSVAVVSDAGTPAFSDPGLELVRAALAAGVRVIPIPGANAALAALVASGLDTSRVQFEVFLAAKPGARRCNPPQLASTREQPRRHGSISGIGFDNRVARRLRCRERLHLDSGNSSPNSLGPMLANIRR